MYIGIAVPSRRNFIKRYLTLRIYLNYVIVNVYSLQCNIKHMYYLYLCSCDVLFKLYQQR